MKHDSSGTIAARRLYAALLYAYPREFRARFGAEMQQVFRDRLQAITINPEPAAFLRFFCSTARDWLFSSMKERIANMAFMLMNNVLNSGQKRLARGMTVAAMLAIAGLFINAKVMQAYVISAPSMEASLRVGDRILVNKLVRAGEIGRDEFVVFRYPDDETKTFVKRVIGLPGDRIRLMDKQVIRNGRRLVEPYVEHLQTSVDPFRDNFPGAIPPSYGVSLRGRDMLAHDVIGNEVTVPADSLFVLGDNRDNSLDSRYWGFVPLKNVVGRPLLVYWTKRTFSMLRPATPQEVELTAAP